MAVFNAAKREIDIKIVYYGPALCGKTTNVQTVHKKMAPEQRGDIMSLATKDDRTLFFDFLPIELGNVKGFKTRFHLYTVPGQVYYALTRRAVLTSVDGVVFVADSQESKLDENIESLNDLDENLKFHKKGLETVPFVMQYNKRDMGGIMSVSDLETALNKYNVPAFESSALKGDGVMETLTSCCKLVLKSLNKPAGTQHKKTIAAVDLNTPKVEAESEPEIKLSEEAPVAEPVAPSEPEIELPEEASVAEPADVIEPEFEFSEETPETESETEPLSIDLEIPDDSSKPELDSTVPSMDESQKAESVPLKFSADDLPEVEIDTSYLAADNEPVTVPDQETSSEVLSSFTENTDIADAEIPSVTISTFEPDISPVPDIISGPGITVLSCGEPQKVSDTSIKVPLRFRLENEGKEGSLNIKINFEDFKLI